MQRNRRAFASEQMLFQIELVEVRERTGERAFFTRVLINSCTCNSSGLPKPVHATKYTPCRGTCRGLRPPCGRSVATSGHFLQYPSSCLLRYRPRLSVFLSDPRHFRRKRLFEATAGKYPTIAATFLPAHFLRLSALCPNEIESRKYFHRDL